MFFLIVVLRIFSINNRNSQRLTLPIKRVYLIILHIEKALLREILPVTRHLDDLMRCDLFRFIVEKEMVVTLSGIVEQIHINQHVRRLFVSIDKTTVDEWVRKVVDWHGVAIQVQRFVDIEQVFILINF